MKNNLVMMTIVAVFHCAISVADDIKTHRFADRLTVNESIGEESVGEESESSVYKDISLVSARGAPKQGTVSTGLDIIFMRPNIGISPPYESKTTLRPWISAVNADGLGVRVRYWEYDGDNTGAENLKASMLDLDLVAAMQLKSLTLTGMVGASRVDVAVDGVERLEGWGPSFGLQGSRQLGSYMTAYLAPRFTVVFLDDKTKEPAPVMQQSIGLSTTVPVGNRLALSGNISCETYSLYSSSGDLGGFIGLNLGTGIIW